MTVTNKIFVDKMGGRSASAYIGQTGDLFYDPTSTTLRISDGETPGGNVVSGGGGSSTPAPVLVSALGSAATAGAGATRFVSNANSRTFGAIVAAGDGTNTASITILGRQSMMEMGSVTFGSNGSSIQIANVAGDFLTALQAGVPIGSTLSATGMGSTSVFTLTSVFAYDAMAQGGSGAWVANTTPVSGSTSPMSVSTITIVTPTTYTVPSPVYSDGTNWRIG